MRAAADMMMTKNSLLRTSAMTPIERAMGRFMRAPDHEAAPAPVPSSADSATPAADPATPTADAQADGAGTPEGGDTTLLGDAGKPEGEGAETESQEHAGAPEAYELSAGEGMTLDADALAVAEPIFREMNLTNDQAQKLTDVYAQIAPKLAERFQAEQLTAVTEQRRAWADEAKSDAEIGGAKWNESIAASAKALDHFGAVAGSPFRQFLDDSGLGNHPEMIRMFAKVGKALGEDPVFVDAKPHKAKTAEEKFYGSAG